MACGTDHAVQGFGEGKQRSSAYHFLAKEFNRPFFAAEISPEIIGGRLQQSVVPERAGLNNPPQSLDAGQ